MTVYQADWICPATSSPIRNGALVVEGGRILGVGHDEGTQGGERVSFPGCAIIPGFVNAHTHLELTFLRGMLDNLPFVDWIQNLTRAKYERCTRETLRLSAILGAIETLSAGVTTVGEVMDLGTGWEAMLECGLHGIAYQEVFGPAPEVAEDALRTVREKVDRHRRRESASQRVGVSPHAPYTVSKVLYEGVKEYARCEGLRMTAHIAESSDETAFVRDGDGPFAEAHRKRHIRVEPRGCLPVAYLDRLQLLGPDMLLIHAVETDAADIARLRETGTFVVHCPKSNAALRHRVAPVAEMRSRQVPVSLGTDSVASNDAVDMFGEMRLASEQQGLRSSEVFQMATIEGARALGMESQVGSLEQHKRADFAVVALRDPAAEPVENMVRVARPSDVRATFVGGREVLFDEREIRRIREKLFESFKVG